MRKYKVGSTKYNEKEFIEKFARKWNHKLTKFTGRIPGGGKYLIGWFHLENMFRIFLRTYNWRKRNEKI